MKYCGDFRKVMILAAVAVAICSSAALAQEAGRAYRVVIVTWQDAGDGVRSFQEHFSRRRIPVEFIHLDAAGDETRLPDFVTSIRQIQPDLIYAWGTSVTQGLVGRFNEAGSGQFIAEIPVVFANVAHPVGSGVVLSMRGSRRNITGSFFLVPAVTQLRAMSFYRPFDRVAVVYDAADEDARLTVSGFRRLEQSFDYQLIELPVQRTADNQPDFTSVAQLIARAARAGADFLYFPPDTFLEQHRQEIGELALRYRLPTFAASEVMLQDSSIMMGVIVSRSHIGQLAAIQAERILVNQERPQDLPIESFADYSLMLNMQTVRELEFYPPMQLLSLANTIR